MATVFKLKEEVVLLLVVLGFAAVTTTTAECSEGSLPKLNDVHLIEGHPTSTTAKYECKPGYTNRGGSLLYKCTDSQWVRVVFDEHSKKQRDCQMIQCGSPDDKDHTTFITTDRRFVFGAVVTYQCDKGYEQDKGVKNNNNIVCQANKKWTVIGFTCGPVKCPALHDPVGGTVITISGRTGVYEYESKYRFTCNKHLYSKGRDRVEVTCRADGTWSEENITCNKQVCSHPTILPKENGKMIVHGYIHGDMVHYTCEDWATVKGNPNAASYCQKDGKWSPPDTDYECVLKEPTCDAPPPISNATPQKDKVKYGNGEEVSYRCDKDYAGNVTATCVDVSWEKEGECKITICRRLPHSDMQGPIPLDQSTKITCEEGYTANGTTAHVECVGGKLLSPNREEFKCSAVKCDEPPTIANADYDKTGSDQFLYGGSGVTYVCDKGYKSGGTSVTLECQADGTWTHAGAKCVPTDITTSTPHNTSKGTWAPSDEKRTAPAATCEAPLTPDNSKLTDDGGDKLVAGSTRVYTCDAGTAVEGSGGASITLECQAGGTWTWTSI